MTAAAPRDGRLAGLELTDPALEAAVRARLDDVEDLLRESVRSEFPFVSETSRHLVEAGGKRFRPLVVLLAGEFGDPTAVGVVPAAVAIELTHLSTLYHDDVMDEAALRRGAESANRRWGNTVAILTGDFLFARASEVTADLGSEATRLLSRTIAVLCEGQIRETIGPRPGADPIEHYLRVVLEKTGSLIATSARLGALLSGADAEVVEVLTRYGEVIGVAFQLSDDLVDLAQDATESGKTPGTDLREGVRTLPVLETLRAGGPPARRLQTLLDDGFAGADGDARVREALDLVRSSPGIPRARAVLRRHAEEARAVLTELPPLPAREALDWLAGYVVSRTG